MSIYHRIEQRSQQWHYLRLGMPTASAFDKIVTPKGKLSEARVPGGGPEGYMHELLAELMLGRPLDLDVNNYQSAYMQRGVENEDAAISSFEFLYGETEPGGFVTNDAKTYGCSPDRLIGISGGLEIKIPGAKMHVGYLLSPAMLANEYKLQVQGCLLVTEREWWNVMSYHPELPPAVTRIQRDEPFLAILKGALDSFAETLLAVRCKMESLYGKFPEPEPPAAPLADDDPGALGVSQDEVKEMIARGLLEDVR